MAIHQNKTVKTAMVMAAGLGTRMKPLTDKLPKALIPVLNIPLLDRTLLNLKHAGIEKVIINTHNKAEILHEHLKQNHYGLNVIISHEPNLLETGGGVVKALPLIADEKFFIINSDVIWFEERDKCLQKLASFWLKNMNFLLLLQPKETAIGHDGDGDFGLSSDNQVIKLEPKFLNPYIFAGIQIANYKVFEDLEISKFSLRDIYCASQKENGELSNVYGIVNSGNWLHVGCPESLSTAEEFLKSNAVYNNG